MYIRVTGNFNEILILIRSSVVIASYTCKLGEIDMVYLHDMFLSPFWNTQCNFMIVYQNFQHP